MRVICAAIILYVGSLVVIASFFPNFTERTIFYHGEERSCGIWNDPNVCGLMMGVGLVMAGGSLLRFCRPNDVARTNFAFCGDQWKWIWSSFFATLCILYGLLHTYSRGAWLATICGFLYFLNNYKCQCSPGKAAGLFNAREGFFWVLIIVVSMILILFWHLNQVGGSIANRVISVANVLDFSWANRLAAWQGALQIIDNHSWFGAGWTRAETLYEKYYMSPKLFESGAFGTNDYLMLGARLGILPLAAFVVYVWSSLAKNEKMSRLNGEAQKIRWLKATCHGGAMVLLVGFWFDGGLFKLAPVSMFCILLGLGNIGNFKMRNQPGKTGIHD